MSPWSHKFVDDPEDGKCCELSHRGFQQSVVIPVAPRQANFDIQQNYSDIAAHVDEARLKFKCHEELKQHEAIVFFQKFSVVAMNTVVDELAQVRDNQMAACSSGGVDATDDMKEVHQQSKRRKVGPPTSKKPGEIKVEPPPTEFKDEAGETVEHAET